MSPFTTTELRGVIAAGTYIAAPIFGAGAYDTAVPCPVIYNPRVKHDPYAWLQPATGLRYRVSALTTVKIK